MWEAQSWKRILMQFLFGRAFSIAPMGGATLSPARPGPHQILNKISND